MSNFVQREWLIFLLFLRQIYKYLEMDFIAAEVKVSQQIFLEHTFDKSLQNALKHTTIIDKGTQPT